MSSKPHAIFVCCGSENDYKDTLIKFLGKDFVDSSVAVDCFGSEINPDRAKGFVKLFVKMMLKIYNKANRKLHYIYEDRISEFCSKVNELNNKNI